MNRISQKHLSISAIAVAVVAIGFSVGFVYRASHFAAAGSAVGVKLDPSVVDVIGDQFEHDLVKVNLQLTNHFRHPVSIVEVRGTCSCSRILGPGGVIFNGPVTLASGESIPICVEIDTTSRIGNQQVSVNAIAAFDDKFVESTSKITLKVRQGWRVEPTQLTFNDLKPGEVISRKLTVSDAFPDPGIGVKKVTVSNNDRLDVEVEAADQGAGTPDGTTFSQAKTRHVITVSFRAPEASVEGRRQDFISLQAGDPKQPGIQVPVLWAMKPPAYSFSPKRLTLVSPKAGETLRRNLGCTIEEGADSNLVVLKAPDYIRVQIKDSEGTTKRIEVECTAPASVSEPGEIVFGAGREPQPVFTLPVRFYREDLSKLTK